MENCEVICNDIGVDNIEHSIIAGNGDNFVYLNDRVKDMTVITGDGDDVIVSKTPYRISIDAGNGNDAIYFLNGAHATVTGGEGADIFNIRIDDAGFIQINDFKQGEDKLSLFYGDGKPVEFTNRSELGYYHWNGNTYLESADTSFRLKLVGNFDLTTDDIASYKGIIICDN